MKKKDFMLEITNGLYDGTCFNGSYTLRAKIMAFVDIARKTDQEFSNWYDSTFEGYTQSVSSRYLCNDEVVFIGRLDENKPARAYGFDIVYKILCESK